MTRKHTRAIRRRNASVLAASTICHLSGHDGADAADHVIPLARGGSDTRDNLKPAHHFEPCPTCGIKCNRVKSDKLVTPIMRRTPGIVRP